MTFWQTIKDKIRAATHRGLDAFLDFLFGDDDDDRNSMKPERTQ